jgi:endoglucanase
MTAMRLLPVIGLFLMATGVGDAEEHALQPSPPVVRGFMVPDQAEADVFPAARRWGANVVRYQIEPVSFAQDRKKAVMEAWPELLAQTVEEVRTAAAAGLKVVVDMHNPPLDGVDRSLAEAWKRPELEKNMIRVWSDLARELMPYHDAVWGYDLYNEPVERTQLDQDGWDPKAWRPLALKLVTAIRAIDPDVWIIYEVGPWDGAEGFEKLEPLPDARVIYSVHFYKPETFTHQGVLGVEGLPLQEARKKVNLVYPGMIQEEIWGKARLAACLAPVDAFQAKYHVPIYAGEFSVARWAPAGSGARWLKDVIDLFEERHWSWTYHAFREWNGWSLEHDSQFWMNGMEPPQDAVKETDRGQVVREFLGRNAAQPQR